MVFPPNTPTENMVNLNSGDFVLIMVLNQSLTLVHSQKDTRLHFGESFSLMVWWKDQIGLLSVATQIMAKFHTVTINSILKCF